PAGPPPRDRPAQRRPPPDAGAGDGRAALRDGPAPEPRSPRRAASYRTGAPGRRVGGRAHPQRAAADRARGRLAPVGRRAPPRLGRGAVPAALALDRLEPRAGGVWGANR